MVLEGIKIGEFEGNISVSNLAGVYSGIRNGRDGRVYESIVDYLEPIEKGAKAEKRTNSTILYGEFPEEFAVRGLVHDAAVDLFHRNQEFRSLGLDPRPQQVLDSLEGSIDGTGRSSSEIRQRLNNLEKKYGLEPDDLLDYEFEKGDMEGLTPQDLLEEVAEYQTDFWSEDTEDYSSIDKEITVFGNGISGRMDLKNRKENRDQIRELKLSTNVKDRDIFQLSAYWTINGDQNAEAVLEYPLIDERLRFNPGSDQNDFMPGKYPVFEVRDTAVDMIEDLMEIQQRHLEFYDDREKATIEAVRDLEVESYGQF